MSSLFFWRTWSRPYRSLYVLVLLTFLLSLLTFITAWARGLHNVVQWNVLSELIDLPITLHTFTDGLLDYAVPGQAYAVTEQFVASVMEVHPWMATGFLAGLALAVSLLLAAVTSLPRTPYLGAMSLLLVTLAVFRFETLDVAGLPGQYVFLLLAFGYGSVSYYLHAFRPDVPFPARLSAFLLVTVGSMLGLGALARVPFPALTAVSYGLPALLVLSAGFILFIAFEIIAGLVWLTSVSRGETGRSRSLGVRNLAFISGLYLINLLLSWLKNTRTVDWDLLAFSPFLLYLISVTLGIWGVRRLIDQQSTLSFRDTGAWLYGGLALLTTLTIAYAFATANDPLIELFEDVIVYSHFAMGVCFLVYVLVNFLPVYQQHLPVYRVLYKPRTLPLRLVRLAGLLGVVGMVAATDYFPLRQAITGYYNGLGDLYTAQGEAASAEAFYQLAVAQEFQNHKANYALASLALAQDNKTAAAFFFGRALLKQPSPQAYANLSSVYEQNNLFFEAIKALQRGIRAFPQSGELQNNLGYLYARTSVADSAYYYFQAATAHTDRDEVPAANLLSLYVRNPQVLAADSSLAQTQPGNTYESYQANALALRLVMNRDTTTPAAPAWLGDPDAATAGLSVGRFASLYNYALAHPRPDTSLTNGLVRRAEATANQDFADDLLVARAVAEYHRYNPATALGQLTQLAEGDNLNGPTYRTTAGLWLLEQGLYRRAAETLELNTDTVSAYYRAVALTKAGDLVAAESLWKLASRNDAGVAALAQVLYDVRKPADDLERAFYVTYRADAPDRQAVWSAMGDATLKTVAGALLAGQYLDQNQPAAARPILAGLPATDAIGPFARSARHLAALQLAVLDRSADAFRRAQQPVLPQHEAARLTWLGRAYAQQGEAAPARQAYQQAVARAPLTSWVVAPAAELLRRQGQVKPAYDLVLNALPFNEDQPEVLKQYILLCLDQGLTEYADNGLLQLELATAPTDYTAFLSVYNEKLAQLEKSKQKFLQ